MDSSTGAPASSTVRVAWSGLQGSTIVKGVPSTRRSRQFQAGLQVLPAPTGYYGYRDGPFSWADLVPSGDGLRVSYVALREMAAGLMYRLVDRQ